MLCQVCRMRQLCHLGLEGLACAAELLELLAHLHLHQRILIGDGALIDQTCQILVKGVHAFLLSGLQHSADLMRLATANQRGDGRIVIITSVAGARPWPLARGISVCTITARRVEATCTRICCWFSGYTSIRRSTVEPASCVCKVANTKWPVSTAVNAVEMVVSLFIFAVVSSLFTVAIVQYLHTTNTDAIRSRSSTEIATSVRTLDRYVRNAKAVKGDTDKVTLVTYDDEGVEQCAVIEYTNATWTGGTMVSDTVPWR